MYIMILDAADFRHEIYQCKYCDGASLGFESASPDGPFFKFPPTIGAAGNADILFVGINPRISNTNKNLHSELTHNIQAFDELAGNRYNGQEYIEAERHYRNHATIVKDLFQGQSFEAAAAVTELFFCATKKTNKLLVESCPCANLFLEKTILHVRPKVIIPVGKIVLRYFQKCFGKDKEVFKIKIEDYHS